MNLYKFLMPLCGVLIMSVSYSQLTIIVDAIPLNTPEGSSIYIAGDFQGWDPADPAYSLAEDEGVYSITINPSAGTLNFKFTRGDWTTAEGNQNGGFLPDRTYSYDGTEQSVSLQILSWEDTGGSNSSAAENVQILDTDFYMPQLDRNRRIWLYLPPDYDTALDKHYPVLYMHDAQNIFDNATSFSGEWEVDETLNELFSQGDYGCIVVGIDNGGVFRLDEYSPWVNPEYGGGQGEEYIQFIVSTLKPFIDQGYRTLPAREYTGIMGSSMGGLISLYAGIEYYGVFGKVGSFSPAYWFADEVFPFVEDSQHELTQRIYTVAGLNEGASMAANVELMDEVLLESGWEQEELNTTIHADGAHSEWYWAREFGDAYLWLFQDVASSISEKGSDISTLIYPNPSTGLVTVSNFTELNSLRLTDTSGKELELVSKNIGTFDVSHLPAGVYFLSALKKDGSSIIFKIKKN